MKKFLQDTIFTFSICIITVLGLEIEIRMVNVDNIYSFKHNYMESHSSKIKTLLLGHSLFEESFNSNVIGDSTFNLAICGRVSFYDVKLLERYINRMDNLEVVLFPIHYALDNPCDYYGDRQGMESYVYHYYKYMDIASPGEMRLYYLPKLTFHWEKKNSGIMEEIDSVDATGYARFPDKDYTIYPPSERRYTQSDPSLYYTNLKRIAQICHERDVRFIAVTPPATDLYLSYTTIEGIQQINWIIDNIRIDYPIEYHNYLADSAFRDENFFHDAVHLNHKGATKFAQRVKKDFCL